MLLYFTLCALIAGAHAAAPALRPMPVKVEAGAGALTVDGAFSAVSTGVSDPRLDSALDRLAVRL
jgi:hypothetical protein